ncbi:MAG: hypothetical protein EPN86_03900 [Nanoarchaeota archaeon]|nr:MAG: hypothetical protein EPN86_03900 [Nanoarchaeota archaeon]
MRLVILAIAALFLLSACSNGGAGELTGKVTIGPLCPVEPCRISQGVMKQIYTSRDVVVFNENKQIAARINLNPDGSYKLNLTKGKYEIVVANKGEIITYDAKTGIGALTKVTVEKGKTATLNLNVDTGIR